MAVIKVERTEGFTVMSNHHLRDKNLSLRGKGLLSFMLSLPETWDYTEMGLVACLKEGRDYIRASLKDLKDAGYLTRIRKRDDKGRLTSAEYIVREKPINEDYPQTEKPMLVKPMLADTTQINTNRINTNKSICEDSSNRGITEADTEKETIPYTQILRLYNESCPSLAQVRNLSAISSQRKKAIKARYEEWGKSIDPFKECFRRAEASDFLTGRSGKWKATGIDWLLKPSNFSKIMEGAYDNRGETPAVSTPAETISYSDMMARQEEERRKRRERDEMVISMQG